MAPRTPHKGKTHHYPPPIQPVVKRFAVEDSPNLAKHILFLFIGSPHDCSLLTIHTNLIPDAAMAALTARARDHGFYRLESYAVDVVEMWRKYLYFGKLFSKSAADRDAQDEGGEDCEWDRLAQGYLLGSWLGHEEFANGVVDALIEKTDEGDRYPSGLASDVWPATVKGDRLRALLVDFHVWKGMGEGLRAPNEDADGPEEFKEEVYEGLRRAGVDVEVEDIVDIWKVDRCRYHTHKSTKRCAR